MDIDLTKPEMAYLFGFLQTDGHLSQNTRNRGRLSIELASRDAGILPKLQALLPVNSSISERRRDTNFKKDSHSFVLSMHDLEARTILNRLGLPYGRKSEIVSPPVVSFSEVDYWRGIVDGNGSLGLTGNGLPFLSLNAVGKPMVTAYLGFMFRITGAVRTVRPTKRDGTYNPCLWKEDAQVAVSALYYEGCLALDRKLALAEEVAGWSRPETMRKRTWDVRRWTPEEDGIVLTKTITESVTALGRSEKSVRMRLHRLRHGKAAKYAIVDEQTLCSQVVAED